MRYRNIPSQVLLAADKIKSCSQLVVVLVLRVKFDFASNYWLATFQKNTAIVRSQRHNIFNYLDFYCQTTSLRRTEKKDTMGDNEQKAMQLMAEAEKKLTQQKGFLGSLFGGSNKVEDAIECYQRAGNMFKMAKNWSKAGAAFCEAATLHARAGSRHDAGTMYVDASNCYKKSDVEEAVACLLKAIDIYTDMGRFTMAAKHHQSIAEMYETDPNTLAKSIQHYEQAADYFRGEESVSSANKCMLKVAQYAAQLEDYDKAIQIYEQVATSSLESSLLKYSAKEYFFRAALCHLSVDLLNAQHAIEKYAQQYPAFQDSREYKLVKILCEHLEEQNIEGFTDAVKDYDSISRLDQWYTTILLRIKKAANEDPDLR